MQKWEREKTLHEVFLCLFLASAACQRFKPWFTATAGSWSLICNHPTPLTAIERSNLQQRFPHLRSFFKRELSPMGRCHFETMSVASVPHFLLPAGTTIAGVSLDLTAWNLQIHDWDIQNRSQITFFHWEPREPCNFWDIPAVGLLDWREKLW